MIDKSLTWRRLEHYPLGILDDLTGDRALEALKDSFTGSTLHRAAEERRAFVTVSRRLGIGPKHLRDGDAIVVLSGVDVPFILREHSDVCEVIGEAYVDGIMDGETKGSKFEMESFLLM